MGFTSLAWPDRYFLRNGAYRLGAVTEKIAVWPRETRASLNYPDEVTYPNSVMMEVAQRC